MPLLSVIIVNYNVRFFLEQCLHSLYKATEGIEKEVWVADNASTDGSKAYLLKLFPEVKWQANITNVGFGAANNQVIEQASGRYTLLLNPDTLVIEDAIQKAIGLLEQKNAVATGIRMIDGCGDFLPESKRAFPAPLPAFYKLSGLAALFQQSPTLNRYALGHLNPQQNHVVEVLAGAFMLIKTDVLKAIGGFDEAFFMYGEDIDLSYRLQHHSQMPNYYTGESAIIHFKGESTNRGSMQYVRHFYGAMHLFVQKHYGKHGGQTGGWLLRLAIYLRSAIAATLLPVAKYHHKNIRPKAIIIAGLPADTGRVGTLLPADILSAATLYPMLPAAALPFLQALKMPRRNVILIWCIGNGFLLKEAVALLPMVKPHAAGIGYHYVGSGSVVGGAGSSSAGFGWGPALH